MLHLLELIELISIPGKGLPTWYRHLWNKKSQRCSKFVNETGIALFHPHIEGKHNAYKVSLTMSHLQVIFEGSGIAASALMPVLPMLWRSRFQSKITQVCISKISTSRQFRIYSFHTKIIDLQFTFISWIVDTLCIVAMISESNGGDIPPAHP